MILPTFGSTPLAAITPRMVKVWHAKIGTGTPVLRAHAYSLLKSILAEAVREGEITGNPCQIKNAGTVRRPVTNDKYAEPNEVEQLADHMPDRLRMFVLLGAWCAFRFGELAELRRRDVEFTCRTVR